MISWPTATFFLGKASWHFAQCHTILFSTEWRTLSRSDPALCWVTKWRDSHSGCRLKHICPELLSLSFFYSRITGDHPTSSHMSIKPWLAAPTPLSCSTPTHRNHAGRAAANSGHLAACEALEWQKLRQRHEPFLTVCLTPTGLQNLQLQEGEELASGPGPWLLGLITCDYKGRPLRGNELSGWNSCIPAMFKMPVMLSCHHGCRSQEERRR